jgi:predicted secreted protein
VTPVSVSARAGQPFTLELSENPTTGFLWQLDAGAPLSILSREFVASGPQPGAGGVRVFTIESPVAGTFVVDARLRRPWQGNSPAIEHKQYVVTVQ